MYIDIEFKFSICQRIKKEKVYGESN